MCIKKYNLINLIIFICLLNIYLSTSYLQMYKYAFQKKKVSWIMFNLQK